MEIYRHGDLIIEEISELPKKLRKAKSISTCVLAEGETTGHKHQLQMEQSAPDRYIEFYPETKDQPNSYIFVHGGPANLQHEEHKKIVLKPGIFKIYKEREYDYFLEETKKVLD